MSRSISAAHRVETEVYLEGYTKIGNPDPDYEHEVVIAISKRNVDELKRIVEDELYEPQHSRYAQWMTLHDVTQLTSNTPGADAVVEWLQNNAINIHWRCPSNGYLKAKATIRSWEQLLLNTFYLWNKPGGSDEEVIMHATSYTVHPSVAEHIFHIFHIVDPPPSLHIKGMSRKLSAYGSSVTPAVISKLYRQSTNSGLSHHKQSVFSTSDEYFSQSDLYTFQKSHGLKLQQVFSIGNHHLPDNKLCSTPRMDTGFSCSEGNLDVQYLMGTAQNTETLYHYVDDPNPFVAYITAVSGQAHPPTVMSISWGSTEQAMSSYVMKSFCDEALALAARGVTILVASGDNGAVGTAYSTDGTCDRSTCSAASGSASSTAKWPGTNTWTGSGYFPSFPSTCAYVTAAGGTMGLESGLRESSAMSNKCYSSTNGGVITSGGGFSTFFERPAWQKDAVEGYFRKVRSPSSGFNIRGRAIPDISIVAVKFLVNIGSDSYHVYGTSAAAPVLAGFVSVVNALRAQRNMTTVGWLNKALYATGGNASLATLFNDVTVGSNNCCSSHDCTAAVCCESGFAATTGWDPVTGWGSVNFDNFARIFSTSAPDYPDQPSQWGAIGIDNITIYLIVIGCACLLYCCWVGVRCCCQRYQRQSASSSRSTATRGVSRPTVRPNAASFQALPPPSAPVMAPANEEACPTCGQKIDDPAELVAHAQMCRL